MEMYRDEVMARAAEAKRGETFAIASLRFMTGVQTAFDIPDEPLKLPERPLAPVVRYLTAARLFRPEINMARAGVVARKAQVDLARARFYPDLGLGIGAAYAVAPGIQRGSWVGDPYNGFGYYFGFGFRWALDLWPQSARVNQAEAQLAETRSLERLALGGVAVEVENAHGVAVEAKARAEMWGNAEKRAREWIVMTRDAIDLGTKDERALAEPIRAYVWARANHLFGLMDYNIAMSELARVSGWDEAAPYGQTPGGGLEALEGR
jgi:outer membrane protein TolC